MTSKEMREPTFLILTSLAGADKQHGYAIMTEVQKITDGGVNLRAGTLYAALFRLEYLELVENAGFEVVDGRARYYYKITTAGKKALREEVLRMRTLATIASARLRK